MLEKTTPTKIWAVMLLVGGLVIIVISLVGYLVGRDLFNVILFGSLGLAFIVLSLVLLGINRRKLR